MKIYQLDIQQIESKLNTNIEHGLPVEENENASTSNDGFFSFLRGATDELKNKFSYVHILVLVSFLISIVFSFLNQTWTLLACCVFSALLFFLLFFVECGALNWLKQKYFKHIETCDESVNVVRAGVVQSIRLDQLKIGDLIPLREGTMLRGDARIISSNRLYADESVVFGRTIPEVKIADAIDGENILPEDQKNMLWKGSYITSGDGVAVVVALDEDCYIYKTGGRAKRGQRSYVYNRRNDFGKILSLVFLLLSFLVLLISGIISGRWVEFLAIFGAMSILISLEPVSCITEWNYYLTAQKIYKQGALVRNIRMFDSIEKEKDVYFDSQTLLMGQLKYLQTLAIDGSEKTALSYFFLTAGKNEKEALRNQFNGVDLDLKKIEKTMPIFQKEQCPDGNFTALFTDQGESKLVLTGYWRKVLPFVGQMDTELIKLIEEMEVHGKMVYLLASKDAELYSGSLSAKLSEEQMNPIAVIAFDILVNDGVYSMIARMKKAGIRIHLMNEFSESFGRNLSTVYDMDDFSSASPIKQNCTVPSAGSFTVYNDASMIEKEAATLILARETMPQKVFYDVKCMFCGINRELNFIGIVSVFLLAAVVALLLKGAEVYSILFPILLFQPILAVLCYFLSETVRNCNQSKRSLVMGVLFGLPTLIASLVGCDMVLLVLGLSSVLYAFVLWWGGLKHRGFKKRDLLILLFGFILAVLPWLFIGGNWLVAILFAVFPAASALVLDLLY